MQFVRDLLNSRYMNILPVRMRNQRHGRKHDGDRRRHRWGMLAGTSPSICALPGGGWQAAFQANTGRLWVVGADQRGDTGWGMKAGTSPSICALPGGGWQAAFQANTGNLWAVGAEDIGDKHLGMMQGTSPSICKG
jgi:hypothetical protein